MGNTNPMNIEEGKISIQVGIRISALRKIRGMTQEELAEKANISVSHLSLMEAQNRFANPTLLIFIRVANALDVPLYKLFEIEEDMI